MPEPEFNQIDRLHEYQILRQQLMQTLDYLGGLCNLPVDSLFRDESTQLIKAIKPLYLDIEGRIKVLREKLEMPADRTIGTFEFN